MFYTKVNNTKNTELKTVAGNFAARAVLGVDTSSDSTENFIFDEVLVRLSRGPKGYNLLIVPKELEVPLTIVTSRGKEYYEVAVLDESGTKKLNNNVTVAVESALRKDEEYAAKQTSREEVTKKPIPKISEVQRVAANRFGPVRIDDSNSSREVRRARPDRTVDLWRS